MLLHPCFVSILDHLHGVRSIQTWLRVSARIDQLIFDEHIADNWSKFKKEWRIYCNAGLSDKTKKVQAYTLLNLAGSRRGGKNPRLSHSLRKRTEKIPMYYCKSLLNSACPQKYNNGQTRFQHHQSKDW